jgi:DNA-binding beta-propeller fold protein YncE
MAVSHDGSLYIAEAGGHRIRKVAPDGSISTYAGTGVAGFSGDGGPASQAQFNTPHRLTIDSVGNLYVADALNNRVRKIQTDGALSTFAGTDKGIFVDGSPAKLTRR